MTIAYHSIAAVCVLALTGGSAHARSPQAEKTPTHPVEVTAAINTSILDRYETTGAARTGEQANTRLGVDDGAILSVRTRIPRFDAAKRPGSGYQWVPELAQFRSEYVNESGWNQSKSDNGGRSGVAAYRTLVEQNGNGDAGAYYANCQIGGTGNAGATHWLAQPACIILNGDVATTLPHSYLNVQEFSLSDNGNDVAGIGTVYRFDRTRNSATQGEVWMGLRNQSTGAKAIDVGVSNAGAVNIGIDTVLATADPDFDEGHVVAINMAAGQKVIYNSKASEMNGIRWFGDTLGSAYDTYSNASGELARCNGASCLKVGTGAVTLAGAGLRLTVISIKDLPACRQGVEGTLYAVSDARSEQFNADLDGGGQYHVMAYCNGTRWKVR